MASQHQGFVGIGGVTNDPFLKRHMAAAGYEFRPQSNLSLNVDVHYSPDLGEADWKPLVEELINEVHVSPDISRINYAGRFGLTVFPVNFAASNIETKVGFGTNIGLVNTSDDLQALDTEGSDERAVVAQHQMHPVFGFVLSGEVWSGPMGGRIRMDKMAYIENVNATTLEMKNNNVVMVDLMRKF
ncbi:MAG: hypothetical protein ACPGTU_03005 [Myxococcota bacterium]